MHPGPALFAPYWRPPHDEVVMLLHMNALPLVDDVGRAVTMVGSGISLTTGVGTSVGQFGKAAVWDATLTSGATMVNDSKMDFGAGPGPVFDVWLRDLPSTSHGNLVFAIAKDGSSIFEMASLTASADLGFSSYVMQFSDTTAGSSYCATLSFNGPVVNPVAAYNHIRFGRVNATTLSMAYNGVIVATTTIAAGLLFNGSISTPGLTRVGLSIVGGRNNWSAAPIDELVARKVWMDATNFTPPTSPFIYP